MSFEIYITRGQHWLEHEPPISDAHWISAAASEPGMHVLTREENEIMGARPDDPWPAGTEWTAHSTGRTIWFNFANGQASVFNADEETLVLMKRLADQLGAQLIRRELPD